MSLERKPSRPPAAPQPVGGADVLRTMDHCTKCGICQAHCPVASVTAAFPGPRFAGPQAERFRAFSDQEADASSELCSGCGICTAMCPNGVRISDIIAISKADAADKAGGPGLGQRLLNRPDLVGRIGGAMPAAVNAALSSKLLRSLAEAVLGIHRDAPVPRLAGRRFRSWLARREQPEGVSLAYFSGCAVEHYEPQVGIAAVRLLNGLGYRVDLPTGACCGLPLLSGGERGGARSRAERLIGDLHPHAAQAVPIVSTSTSCALTLQEKYAAYLDLVDDASRSVASGVIDICAFLRANRATQLGERLRPLRKRVLYHGPCQQRGHRVGVPAIELLRLIPGLSLEISEAACCGVAGTYGYDRDKRRIATDVGRTLADQIARSRPDVVVCDSETCRWSIAQASQVPCRHPVELLAEAIAG